jgi:hypothetical protein
MMRSVRRISDRDQTRICTSHNMRMVHHESQGQTPAAQHGGMSTLMRRVLLRDTKVSEVHIGCQVDYRCWNLAARRCQTRASRRSHSLRRPAHSWDARPAAGQRSRCMLRRGGGVARWHSPLKILHLPGSNGCCVGGQEGDCRTSTLISYKTRPGLT